MNSVNCKLYVKRKIGTYDKFIRWLFKIRTIYEYKIRIYNKYKIENTAFHHNKIFFVPPTMESTNFMLWEGKFINLV